jgi:hypothetical protein
MQITIIGRFKDMVAFTRTGLEKSRRLESESVNESVNEKKNGSVIEEESEREAPSTSWIIKALLDRSMADTECRFLNVNRTDCKAMHRGKSIDLNRGHLKAGGLEAQSQGLDLALVLYKVTQNLLVRNWELLASLNPRRNSLVPPFNLARISQHHLPMITHSTTNLPRAAQSL